MNQPYRVRLKTKTKIKIFFVLVILISFMSFALWALVTSSIFKQQDSIVHTNFMVVYPEQCKLSGTPLSSYAKHCKFKLAEGVYFEAYEVLRFNEEGYCIAQLFKNGVFIDYVLQPREQCE
jgi:hypothetical protein